MRLVITGTPGTGKTTLAKALARQLQVPYYSVNALVKRDKRFAKPKGGRKGRKERAKADGGEFEVDTAQLQRFLESFLKGKRRFVLEGHLACEVNIPCERVLVLRCNPKELKRRLQKRKGYSQEKVSQNVWAEALDYCLVQTEAHYARKRIAQMDFTNPLSGPRVLSRLKGGRQDRVRWLLQMKKDPVPF